MKVTTDAPCTLIVDDINKGVLKPGEMKRVYLTKGTYMITAISSEYSLAKYKTQVEVKESSGQELLEINMLDEIKSEKKARCTLCHGTGYYESSETCSKCEGLGENEVACYHCTRGKVTCSHCNGTGEHKNPYCSDCPTRDCSFCHGTGKDDCDYCYGSGKKREKCYSCSGTGRIKTQKVCTAHL